MANRLTLSASQGGLLQSETTQGVHEHVGGGGQIQPELIGAHRCRAGPVGEQIQLLFFYAVLHVAPRTVEVFVESAGPQAFRRQGGDDESGIGAFLPADRAGSVRDGAVRHPVAVPGLSALRLARSPGDPSESSPGPDPWPTTPAHPRHSRWTETRRPPTGGDCAHPTRAKLPYTSRRCWLPIPRCASCHRNKQQNPEDGKLISVTVLSVRFCSVTVGTPTTGPGDRSRP